MTTTNNTTQDKLTPPPQGSAITSDDLNGSSGGLNLPDYTPDTSGSSLIDEVSLENKSAIDKRAEDAKAERDSSTSDITKLMSDVGIIEGKKGQYEDEYGVDTIQKNIDDLQSQIDIESNAIRNKVDSFYKNPNLTQTLVNRLATEAERTSASYIADLSIAKNIYSRDYDRAVARADKKVEMELAPVKAELEAKKFVFESNRDSWSESERAQLTNIIAKEQRAYEDAKEKASALEKQKIDLFKNGAPESLLSTVRDAKTIEDIYKIPGVSKYLVSKAERLDMELKDLQIKEARAKLSGSSSGGKIVNVNGVDYIQNEDGSLSNPILPGSDLQKENEKLAMQDKIQTISTLLDHKGKNSRVGTSSVSRKPGGLGARIGAAFAGAGIGAAAGAPVAGVGAIPGAVLGFGAGASRGVVDDLSGKGADFSASVKQLTDQATLTELLELKKAGGTLGSIAIKELEILQNSATKLNNWELKNKDGTGKGIWNIDEKSFDEELLKVQTSYTRILNAMGGAPLTEEEITSNFWNSVDSALVNNANVAIDSGYDAD